MKNLVFYNQNCVSVYDEALNRKNSEELKQRLAAIKTNIVACYISYTDAFKQNNLQGLVANGIFAPHKKDLNTLYEFGSFTIRNLKKHIDGLQPFPLSNVCQNCTINSVNTM